MPAARLPTPLSRWIETATLWSVCRQICGAHALTGRRYLLPAGQWWDNSSPPGQKKWPFRPANIMRSMRMPWLLRGWWHAAGPHSRRKPWYAHDAHRGVRAHSRPPGAKTPKTQPIPCDPGLPAYSFPGWGRTGAGNGCGSQPAQLAGPVGPTILLF